MRKVLLTGYEAFANTPVNPAEMVARRLDGTEIEGSSIVSLVMPNIFFKSIDHAVKVMEEEQPDVVVMMGEYGGRAMITVERIAQNLNDGTRYQLLDNAGYAMQDELTAPDGPAAYYTTLPIRAIVKAMREEGIPADISDTAATFCCNHLMYGVLHHIAVNKLPIRAGWIHLPHLPEVAALVDNLGAPSMSVETATVGVAAGIAAILKHDEDITDVIPSVFQI